VLFLGGMGSVEPHVVTEHVDVRLVHEDVTA
jgi:hypothetical protein